MTAFKVKCRLVLCEAGLNSCYITHQPFKPQSSLYTPPGATPKNSPCVNPVTPNDLYMSRTAPLTSKHCILYIYSTNVGTEYFKHALYSPFFYLQNAVCFIMLTCLVPVLFTFYIQGVLKLKKNNSGAKGLKACPYDSEIKRPLHRSYDTDRLDFLKTERYNFEVRHPRCVGSITKIFCVLHNTVEHIQPPNTLKEHPHTSCIAAL